jgi:AcrR family transcriptional regulator
MKRQYRSALRNEQRQATRERIVEAFIEQLGSGAAEFSILEIAKTANVSVRTVYHHFPDRESQIAAVCAHIESRIGPGERTAPEFGALLAAYARIFDRAYQPENEPVVRAQLSPGIARHVRLQRRRAREESVLTACITAAGKERGRLAAAALSVVASAEIGFAMKDRFGLSNEQVAGTHKWLLRVVVDAIEKGDLAGLGPSAEPNLPQSEPPTSLKPDGRRARTASTGKLSGNSVPDHSAR